MTKSGTAPFADFDKLLHSIVFVRGVSPDKKPIWAFAAIQSNLYAKFKIAEAKGTYDLSQFGSIIEHGQGIQPPEEVLQHMRSAYGASMDFEENLLDELHRFIEEKIEGDCSPSDD